MLLQIRSARPRYSLLGLAPWIALITLAGHTIACLRSSKKTRDLKVNKVHNR